jgi:E3 ubiquitin-protein ligase BAH
MKFARTFDETLEGGNFPPEWQAAAIHYRQLKKCIRRVQAELAELGLDLKTLKALISEQEQQRGGPPARGVGDCEDEKQPMLQYMFDGTLQRFQPKLVLTMHDQDGLRFDLGLSEETKRSLEKLLESRGIPRMPGAVVEEEDDLSSVSEGDSETVRSCVSSEDLAAKPVAEEPPASTIEIPLNHDSEFFHILTSELISLDEVQSQAAKTLEGDIVSIGNSVTAVSAPVTLVSRSDLYPWREIFRIYVESGIFFSTLEMESHKERTAEEAEGRLQKFTAEVERLGLQKSFKHRSSPLLFARFIGVNKQVLKVLRFQAINKMAMQKILKS